MRFPRLVLAAGLLAAAFLAATGLACGASAEGGARAAREASETGQTATGAGDASEASWRPSPAWKRAARELTIPIYEPSRTFGLRLAWVNRIVADPGCVNDGREQLRSFYGSQAGSYFELMEGYPRYCHDRSIEAPIVRRVAINGKRVPLYDANGRLALEWCRKGTTLTLVADGLSAPRVVSIARSVKPVNRAAGKPCAS